VTHRQLSWFAVALGTALLEAGCSSTSKSSGTGISPTTPSGNPDAGGNSDGASQTPATESDSGGPDGASQTDAGGPVPIGTPCIPPQEHDPTFQGSALAEIGVEPNAASCNGGVCVIDHFQGLSTCPYGQQADGGPVPGASSACTVPGTETPVQVAVTPWCSNRPPSEAVICSCRCEDVNGGTDDSGVFSACPTGFTCTQLVSSLGPAIDSSLTGGYCIKTGTEFEPDAASCLACDPSTNPCP
jgi:hypothetical protein